MLISTKINLSILQKAQEEYRQYSNQYTNIQDLVKNCTVLNLLIKECPNVIFAIENAFQQHCLQSSILTEYAAFSLFAKSLHLFDIKPIKNNTCRCIYTHPQKNIELRQYGGCQYLDGEIYKNNQLIRKFEIKQKIARTMDSDLGLVVNGHIKVRSDIKDAWYDYIPFIEKIDFWKNLGHNIKLNDKEINRQIALTYLQQYGPVEILLFGDKGLYYLSPTEYMQHLSYSTSEIRTCGKNHTALYNIDVFMQWLFSHQGVINNDIITLPFLNVESTKGRGSTQITRYKMNYIFWVPAEKVNVENGLISFHKQFIRENKPNASIHAIFMED